MPTVQSDIQQVREAREKAQQAGRETLSLQGKAETFEDRVRGRLRQRRQDRNLGSLRQQMSNITGQIVSEPAQLRERFGDLDPLRREALVQQELGQLTQQQGNVAGIIGQQEETVSDIVGGGVNMLKQLALQKQVEAESAQQDFNNLITEIQLKEMLVEGAFERQQKLSGAGDDSVDISELYGLEPGTLKVSPEKAATEIRMSQEKKGKRLEAKSELAEKISKIDRVAEILKSGEVITGPRAGRYLNFKIQTLGMGSQKEMELWNLLNAIGTKKLFELGGKRIPISEERRIEPIIPSMRLSNAQNIQNLTTLRQEILSGFERMDFGIENEFSPELEDEFEI